MTPTEIALHRAIQYLATFGKNFIKQEEDDSHTNVGWNPDAHCFESRTTETGRQLILDCEKFELRWVGGRELKLGLTGRSHSEVIVWMYHSALHNGLNDYEFHLHYRIDSGRIDHEVVYPRLDPEQLKKINSYRDLSWQACQDVIEFFDFKSELRVWPHHFDTGGVQRFDEYKIGFGMAVPDNMIEDYYLYVSGYRDAESISPEGFSELNIGTWKDEEFKGAVLALDGSSLEDSLSFFKESISILMDKASKIS